MSRRWASRLRSSARDDSGSVTIEYVLWISLFGTVFTIIADLTSIFTANAEMWHVGQDAVRRLSVAQMTAGETESYVRSALAHRFGDSVTVVALDADPVVVDISAPFSEVTVFAMVPGLGEGNLHARLVMRDELAAMQEIDAAAEAEADGLASSEVPLVETGG